MTPGPEAIRPAREEDAPAILSIYAPIVRESHVTFEAEPPTEAAIRERIRYARHPWIVHDEGHGVAGYAYGSEFRPRPAYRWTVEASIYVARSMRGRGIGAALGRALTAALAEAGYRNAVGVVALPNPASEALLERLGFRRAGVLEEAGFKLDRWWDVALYQRALEDGGES